MSRLNIKADQQRVSPLPKAEFSKCQYLGNALAMSATSEHPIAAAVICELEYLSPKGL